MKNALFLALMFFAGFFAARLYYTPSTTVDVSTPQSVAASGKVITENSETDHGSNFKNQPAAPRTLPKQNGAMPNLSGLPGDSLPCLENLTEEHIDAWRKQRGEKIDAFLNTNGEFWHVGSQGEKSNLPGRLDLNVLQAALGTYECKITYEIRDTKVRSNYQFTLDLNGAESKAKNHLHMEGGSGEMQGSMTADFSWQYLGSEGRDLNVVWYNSNGNELRYISSFAFRLRSGMAAGERASSPLMGLSPKMIWNEIGTVECRKTR